MLPCHWPAPQQVVQSRFETPTRHEPLGIDWLTVKYEMLKKQDELAPSVSTCELPVLAWLTTLRPMAAHELLATAAVQVPGVPEPQGTYSTLMNEPVVCRTVPPTSAHSSSLFSLQPDGQQASPLMQLVSSVVVQEPLPGSHTPLLQPTVTLEQSVGIPPEHWPAVHCSFSLQRLSLHEVPSGRLLGAQVPAPSHASGASHELDDASPHEIPAGNGWAAQVPFSHTAELHSSMRDAQSSSTEQVTLPPVDPDALVEPPFPALVTPVLESSSSELLRRLPCAQAAKLTTASTSHRRRCHVRMPTFYAAKHDELPRAAALMLH